MEDQTEPQGFTDSKDYFEDLQVLSEQEDIRFGVITLVKAGSAGAIMFIKQTDALEQDDHVRDTLQAKERLALTHDFILPFLDYKCESRQVEDRRLYSVKGLFGFPVYDLSNILERRKSQRQRMSFAELMDVMIPIVSALAHTQRVGVLHGDIRPRYIGSMSQSPPNWVLLDRLADNNPPHMTQYNHFHRKDDLYMSPVLYASLLQGQTRLMHKPHKSDLFSLGIVLLECALLRNVSSGLYTKTGFNLAVLSQYLQECYTIYQDYPLFLDCLGKMLAIEEKSRPDPLSFLEFLKGKQTMTTNFIQIQGQSDPIRPGSQTNNVGIVKITEQRSEPSQIDTDRPQQGSGPVAEAWKGADQGGKSSAPTPASKASSPVAVSSVTQTLSNTGKHQTEDIGFSRDPKYLRAASGKNSQNLSLVDRSGLSRDQPSGLNESALNGSGKEASKAASHSNKVISVCVVGCVNPPSTIAFLH